MTKFIFSILILTVAAIAQAQVQVPPQPFTPQTIDCQSVKFVIDRTVPFQDCVYKNDPMHCTVVTYHLPGGFVYFAGRRALIGKDLVDDPKQTTIRFTGSGGKTSGFVYFYLPRAVYGRASATPFPAFIKGVAGGNFSRRLSCVSTLP